MKRLQWLAVGVAALCLMGCSDPIKAVQSDEASPSYDQAYWTQLFANQPQVYNQAVSYCQYNTTKPNCTTALNVWFQKGYAPLVKAEK